MGNVGVAEKYYPDSKRISHPKFFKPEKDYLKLFLEIDHD